MLCTGAKTVNFVVFTLKDMHVSRIERNDRFISDMVVQLTQLYEQHFKLAIFDKFVAKNYFTDIICRCKK